MRETLPAAAKYGWCIILSLNFYASSRALKKKYGSPSGFNQT